MFYLRYNNMAGLFINMHVLKQWAYHHCLCNNIRHFVRVLKSLYNTATLLIGRLNSKEQHISIGGILNYVLIKHPLSAACPSAFNAALRCLSAIHSNLNVAHTECATNPTTTHLYWEHLRNGENLPCAQLRILMVQWTLSIPESHLYWT